MPIRVSGLFAAITLSLLCLQPFAPAGQRKTAFGVSVMATRHDYFRDMLDEITKEADKAGVDIVAGDADYSLPKQIAMVDDFIARKVDMILIAPVDSAAIVPALEKARAAGIPVMTVDVAADWPHSVSHVASDNVAGGRLAGGVMLEHLQDRGKRGPGTILVLDHAGVTSTQERARGFQYVMRLRGSQYTVVTQDAVGQLENADRKTAEAIADYGPALVGIFGSNDGTSLGALKATQEKGKLDDIVIVAYDYIKELEIAVNDGKISAIIVQFPRTIGAEAFKIANDFVTRKNTTPPREKLIEIGTYAKEGFFDQRGNPISMP